MRIPSRCHVTSTADRVVQAKRVRALTPGAPTTGAAESPCASPRSGTKPWTVLGGHGRALTPDLAVRATAPTAVLGVASVGRPGPTGEPLALARWAAVQPPRASPASRLDLGGVVALAAPDSQRTELRKTTTDAMIASEARATSRNVRFALSAQKTASSQRAAPSQPNMLIVKRRDVLNRAKWDRQLTTRTLTRRGSSPEQQVRPEHLQEGPACRPQLTFRRT
jgi:hypothetical protein